ncbi:MAG: GvpL/GvpF family gas vesicle protein [Bacteroidota bacterium]
MNKHLLYCISKEQPTRDLPALDGAALRWIKIKNLFVASGEVPNDISTNLANLAYGYQQIAQLLHKEINFLPLPFPTTIFHDQLKVLLERNGAQINSLIAKYGSFSEHSLQVVPLNTNLSIPRGLMGDQKGLSYLRDKHKNFLTKEVLQDLAGLVSDSADKVLSENFLGATFQHKERSINVHLLCNKKQGLTQHQLDKLRGALESVATIKEIGVFPPFHFVSFKP